MEEFEVISVDREQKKVEYVYGELSVVFQKVNGKMKIVSRQVNAERLEHYGKLFLPNDIFKKMIRKSFAILSRKTKKTKE